MAAWPETLPQAFLQDGFQDSEPKYFVTTEMDAGPPKIRRRFTATSRPISGDMVLTSTQKGTLKTFYRNYGANEITTFPDPDGGTDLTVVFSEPPTYTVYAGADWKAHLSFVVLPS